MSIYLGSNLKFLRKKSNQTQADIGLQLSVGGTTIGNWEKGISSPNLEETVRITKIFGISIDELINKDLQNVHLTGFGKHPEKQAKSTPKSTPNSTPNYTVSPTSHVHLNEPNTPYFTGKMPSIVTVNEAGIDNILYVPIRAQAGYLIGYADTEFIESLPSFRMPGLNNATFRMFEVQGVSMSPTLSDKDRVIAEWVPSLSEIRENRIHIIIHSTGVLVKRVLNRVQERNKLYLKSDTLTHRSDYPLLEIDPADIKEIWYVRLRVSSDLREPSELYQRVSELEINQLQILKKLGIKQGN